MFLIISQFLCSLSSAYVRNRHERSTRTLTFDVEPKTSVTQDHNSHHHHHPQRRYVQVGTHAINLTCTITQPAFGFTFGLKKDQHMAEIANNSMVKTELLKSNTINVNDEIDDAARFTTFDTTASDFSKYTLAFQISNLQLSDNGKYICSYNKAEKDFELVVYGKILFFLCSCIALV